MAEKIVDVAIIGAGPGGLAAAIALRAVTKNLAIKVFEKSKELKFKGAAITISSSGVKVIESISPSLHAELLQKGDPLTGIVRRTMGGDTIASIMFSPPADGGPRFPMMVAISWYNFQQLLLSQLPEGTVVLGRSFQSLHQEGDCVEVRFANGNAVRARAVIGCDGNSSAMWGALFPEKPVGYTGVAAWRTMIPRPDNWTPVGTLEAWEGHKRVLAVRSLRDVITISGIAPWDEDRLDELERRAYYGDDSGTQKPLESKRQRFLATYEEIPEPLRGPLLDEDASFKSMLEHGIFFRPKVDCWGHGTVTLLGDAAHVMPPNFGQGTTLALEDAWQLAACVSKHGLTEEALREYEAIRIPRTAKIFDAVMEGIIEFRDNGRSTLDPSPSSNRAREYMQNADYPPLSTLVNSKII